MPSTPPVVVPSSTLTNSLLLDVAPELPFRLLPHSNVAPPSSVPRALFSLLLRATSETDATAAKQSLIHLPTLSQSAPLQCLGFPSDTSVFSHQLTFANFLMDLLLSACRSEPLSPLAAALTFYNVAGPGTGDADEYHTDTPDPRAPASYSHLSTPEIRVAIMPMPFKYLQSPSRTRNAAIKSMP